MNPSADDAAGADDPPDRVFRALFAASSDALLVVDAAGTIVLANAAAHELFDYPPGSLDGRHVDALVPDTIRPRHAAFRAAFEREPRARPMGAAIDLVARRRDGSEVGVEIALSPLQREGLPFVVAAVRAVDAYPRVRRALRRQRYAEAVARYGRHVVDVDAPEEAMREAPRIAAEALEFDAAALYLLEPDGQRFRLAGVVGESEAPEGALVLLGPETLPGRVLADGRAIVVEDDRERPAPGAPALDAQRRIVSTLGVPLVDQRRLVGVLQVGATEPGQFGDDELRFVESLAHLAATTWQRARSDEALRHAQRMESVGELTGGIAHDFNNLLTVIQGNLQVLDDLLDGEASTLAQPLLGTAMRATRRAAELTGKLLAFSRRQVLQPTRVDVAALLQSLAEMLRRTLDQRIEIDLAIEPALPACLADAAQLESALLNLAINARDAMPEGGRLAFTARRIEALPEAPRADADALPPPGYLAIAVADTGVGMSEEVRARAFEPFFTTKAAGRGTGLGLSSVYGFAHQSHGGATIESAPGVGTTVVLYLPQAPAGHETDQAAFAPAPVVAPGLKVLLVEDEPGVRRVAETFLAGWGCRITPCASAEEALDRLAADPEAFDLLLSDVVLGRGMRGSELAPRARALQPRLAMLLMSGYAEGLRAGGDAAAVPLLSKPFTRDELARAIAAITAPSPPPAADRTRKPS